MLIKLNSSIADNISKLSEKHIDALNYLSLSVKDGKHILLSDSNTFLKLSKNEMLDRSAQIIYRKLYDIRPQIAQIMDYVDRYIEVVIEDNIFEKTHSGKYEIINVSLLYFDDISKIIPCNLLCEDISDCEFYIRLTQYIKKEIVSIFPLNICSVNGGGVNSSDTYENILKNNYACIAIMDSDKRFRNDNYKETAENLVKKYKQYSSVHLTNMYILKVREKENLIPAVIYNILEPNCNLLNNIYNNSKYRDVYYFGDIKSGLSLSDELVRKYISDELNSLYSSGNVNLETLEKIANCWKKANLAPCFIEEINIIINSEKKLDNNSDGKHIIDGVRKLFGKINDIFLSGILQKQIAEIKQNNDMSTLSGSLLEYYNKISNLNDALRNAFDNAPEEYKLWWNEIAMLCFSWGCSIKIQAYC